MARYSVHITVLHQQLCPNRLFHVLMCDDMPISVLRSDPVLHAVLCCAAPQLHCVVVCANLLRAVHKCAVSCCRPRKAGMTASCTSNCAFQSHAAMRWRML